MTYQDFDMAQLNWLDKIQDLLEKYIQKCEKCEENKKV